MKADDALYVLETTDLVDDVGFQVNPVEACNDGLPQQGHAFFLASAKAAAIGRPAHRGNQGASFALEETVKIGCLGQEIQTGLDQLRAALGGLLDLDLHHAVPCSSYYHADFAEIERLGGVGGLDCFNHVSCRFRRKFAPQELEAQATVIG
jgi:hypothetical protein